MDEILKQILAKLDNLEKGQEALRQGQEAQGRELKELRQAWQKTDEKLTTFDEKLTKLAIHVEGKLTDRIDALYDARGLVLESLSRIEQRQDRQDERLDQHWHEILVLKNKRR